jgi:hypothetical protein
VQSLTCHYGNMFTSVYVNKSIHAKKLQIFTKHGNYKINPCTWWNGNWNGSTYFTIKWIKFPFKAL